jgi:hypothetical protein
VELTILLPLTEEINSRVFWRQKSTDKVAIVADSLQAKKKEILKAVGNVP